MGALSLADIYHLEAAVNWYERGQRANCFDELERIDHNNRGDARELALRWKLSNQWKLHVAAMVAQNNQPRSQA
jgi:hypothetical protein